MFNIEINIKSKEMMKRELRETVMQMPFGSSFLISLDEIEYFFLKKICRNLEKQLKIYLSVEKRSSTTARIFKLTAEQKKPDGRGRTIDHNSKQRKFFARINEIAYDEPLFISSDEYPDYYVRKMVSNAAESLREDDELESPVKYSVRKVEGGVKIYLVRYGNVNYEIPDKKST